MAELTAQHFKGAAPVLPSGFAGVFAVSDYIHYYIHFRVVSQLTVFLRWTKICMRRKRELLRAAQNKARRKLK